jgi:transcription initiation factor TFIIA large subunit
LSKLHVAQMPWDPKPVAQPVALPPTYKDEHDQQMLSQQSDAGVHGQHMPEMKYDQHVKQEARYDNGYGGMSTYPGSAINPMARERASNLLQQQFGSQANASIQAAGLPQQTRPLSLPGQQRPQQQQQQQGQQRAPPGYHQGGLGAAQHDGAAAGEWAEAVALARTGEADRAGVDGMLRERLDALALDLDGGVFSSVSRAPRKKAKAARKAPGAPSAGGLPQLDGDGVTAPEDAINSDLDDTDDELEQQQVEDDGAMSEMILCTWDKVNRVKNKVRLAQVAHQTNGMLTRATQWRCTLKDGILTTGGKE